MSGRGKLGRAIPTLARRLEDDKPFAVWCKRQDGRKRIFQSYPTEAEAEAVAQRLCAVGCRASVQTR